MRRRGSPPDPRGPRPHSGGQGAVCGARRRRPRNASGPAGGRKDRTGRDPGPPLGPGRAAKRPRQEAGWGRAEAAAARAQLGAAGEQSGQRLGWVGGPPGGEAGNREAALLAERRGRRETPDGLGAPPASCGGSRSQSGARAQTSGRQRTPASGPQGPRGERGVPGPGAGRGAGPPGSARVHVAEAPPPPARLRVALGAEWLAPFLLGRERARGTHPGQPL